MMGSSPLGNRWPRISARLTVGGLSVSAQRLREIRVERTAPARSLDRSRWHRRTVEGASPFCYSSGVHPRPVVRAAS